MELSTAVRLIEKGVDKNTRPQIWTDLGAGHGLFTKALATLLPEGSILYAIDNDDKALQTLSIPPGIQLNKLALDFVNQQLKIEEVDGLILGNSIHFVSDKESLIRKLKKMLKASGKIIVIEYDMDKPNPWVPYPISFDSLQKLANAHGFVRIERIGEQPSIYHRATIYSALLIDR